ISGVRRRIHTGLPRHSTVIISPGASLLTSASTAAPAALARSDGVRLATNGTAVATAATPPAADVASNKVRRLLSILSSTLMTLFPERNTKDPDTKSRGL